MTAPTRILGIDPGLRLTGYGCLDTLPASESIVEAGVLRLGRASASSPLHTPTLPTPPLDITSISARLAELDRDLRLLLSRLKPSIVAVEQLFAHPKHPATAITMAHARGIILLAVKNAGLQLIEIRPNEIKKSLTGYGHAAKGQMQDAIQAYFRLESTPKPPDVADALAIALCAASKHHRGLPTSTPPPKEIPPLPRRAPAGRAQANRTRPREVALAFQPKRSRTPPACGCTSDPTTPRQTTQRTHPSSPASGARPLPVAQRALRASHR